MKKYYLILLGMLFLLLEANAKPQLNITFLVNSSQKSPSELKSMVNLIYLNAKTNADKFTIYHLTGKHESTATWNQKKKTVEYKPIFKDCNFEICGTLNTLISSNKTERSKFFNCNTDLSCDTKVWDLETSRLNSQSESVIMDKIQEEVSLFKNSKQNTSLFFYISNADNEVKPIVTFVKDTIEIKADEAITLHPVYSKSVAKVEWSPTNGLSCADCKEPTVSLQNNNIYTVTVWDSANCKNTSSKTIAINVRKSCFCSKGTLKQLSDYLGSSIRKYRSDDFAKANYQIVSNQSGGWVFDFMTKPNCASRFEVTVKELLDGNKSKVIWGPEKFDRSDVDKRGNFELLENYPSNFVFRLTLDDIKEELHDPDKVFTLQIDSYDDENETCNSYISPKLIFAKCGQ